ncbi:DEAD/DEAH box helicase [Haliangium sp.]|uniref:DEAD/DEAH box helicase n=1 Tax=Haliangium sp. TaxID=2663208 RepID=UPI003D0E5EE1
MSAPARSAFARLSPALQYQIVNALGFRELRPVQEEAAHRILDGANCVVLAPTAGGKTEAALFPLLSQMDREDWAPVSVLYVAPIRALLNNQEERLIRYAGLVGRRAFKWHGDVSQAAKKRFWQEPADVLLTTPESLEAMLMSRRVPARRLFRHLRAVVIDEVHAFVGDDRGGHLSAVLERLSRLCGNDVQRIGLSATVGNPSDLLDWAAGSSGRPGAVVDPGGARVDPGVTLDYVGSVTNAAIVIAGLHRGKKRLVFADSRRLVEELGRELVSRGVDAYVIHGSLSFDERRLAEDKFERGRDCVIVATSAMELGIDIGDLDHVIQIDAPTTVAAFLQRMGRSGRRQGALPNCLFLATNDDGLQQAAALIHLWEQGFVESLPIVRFAPHLLAHQIMALSVQEGGVPVAEWWAWICRATPFRDIDEADRQELVETMVREDILCEVDGRLVLGTRGERLYGKRHFLDLYAVFSAPPEMTVIYGSQVIGTIAVDFVTLQGEHDLSFTLAAQAWRAERVDWHKSIIYVSRAESGRAPRWTGSRTFLSRALCRAIRDVLAGAEVNPRWSRRAQDAIARARDEHDFLDPEGDSDLVRHETGYRLYTFAGGADNVVLARLLEEQLGERVSSTNLYLGLRDRAAHSEAAIRDALRELTTQGRPNDDDVVRLATSCVSHRLSKFQPCLGDRLEARYVASTLARTLGAPR